MLHDLKRHCPEDGSELVDALRPEGFAERRQVMDEREGVGKTEKIFKRLTEESKTHTIRYQQKKSKSPQPAPRFLQKAGRVWTAEMICGDWDCCSGGESEQGMLSGGHGPAEVRVSFPLPLKFHSFFPPQDKQASNQGGLAANNS